MLLTVSKLSNKLFTLISPVKLTLYSSPLELFVTSSWIRVNDGFISIDVFVDVFKGSIIFVE